MLSTLLIWVYITVMCLAYGWLWVELVAKAGYVRAKNQIPGETILIAGSGGLSVLLGVLHIWLPVAVTVQVILFLGAVGICCFFKNNLRAYRKSVIVNKEYSKLYYSLLAIFAVLILIHAAQPATNPDTGLYHAQTITWFNSYRIVPGLGNLYGPLALNSHAHLVISFFNFAFGTKQVLNQTWSSWVFFVYSSFAIRQVLNSLKTRPDQFIFFGGTLFWGLVFFRDWISSPTPDTVVMFFFFFLFGILLITDRKLKSDWELAFLSFLLPVVITFKLSAIYGSLLGVAWLLLHKEQVNSRFFKFMSYQASIVLVPFIIRNLILTGHLLYPLPALDLFNLDWEVPPDWLRQYQVGISAYSRVPTAHWSEYIHKPLADWVGVWWQNQDRPVKYFFTILIMFLPFICYQVISLGRRRLETPLIALWLSALGASLAWFLTAPAVRFGYGYLVPTLLLGVVILVRNRISFALGLGMVGLLGLYGLNGIYKQLSRATFSVIWPAPYLVPETEIRQIGRIKVRVATGLGRCYSLLPCTVADPHPGLEQRGKNLRDGYRTAIPKAGE